jgi:iron uptake system EfeUOB component EfeO/EfeM
MRHVRGRVTPIVPLLVLGTLLTACSGGSTIKPTTSDLDCSAVTGAARQIVLQNPKTVSQDEIDRINAAADGLAAAAEQATTPVAEPARQLATTAKAYAEALANKDIERATITEGQLRREAEPVADACGMADRPDQLLGTTSGTAADNG